MKNYRQMKNLFLRQSYIDSWGEYQNWLEREKGWDYIILTASNEAQAQGYRQEIEWRRNQGYLPKSCRYLVLADPDGKRVGSGGATLNVLKVLAGEYGDNTASVFRHKKILVIHSGGDSKRIPQYSVCGKLFSPVPRRLEDGRPSTLFDEFMIAMSAVAGRFEEGMLVLSGDVLLLFNPLQLDFQYKGAAAISIKADVTVGKNHGVFLNNGQNYVGRFLHKQSEEQLCKLGAVNDSGKVDLDTGAVIMDSDLLGALFSLISTEGVYDEKKFAQFVNDKARISFYGDFLYPLASEATLEEYYKEAPEGDMCQELLDCRTLIWEALSPFRMKLLCLSPAEFIHFGTTGELLRLMTEEMGDYHFLDWSSIVYASIPGETENIAAYNSIVHEDVQISGQCYIENSRVGAGAVIGKACILSGVEIADVKVPVATVLHGLELPDIGTVVRVYGIQDNPKAVLENGANWLGENVQSVLDYYEITPEKIWHGEEHYLWFADLYPVCDSMAKATEMALLVYKIFRKKAQKAEVQNWLAMPRMSLFSSFNHARAKESIVWNRKLTEDIAVELFVSNLKKNGSSESALQVFENKEMSGEQFQKICMIARNADFGLKIRLYYSLAAYLRVRKTVINDISARKMEELCFDTIQKTICDAALGSIRKGHGYRICKEECNVALPVRVNWGGGWTDTPPYCNENGGIVLNAALKLKGIYPVQVSVRKLDRFHVEFASEDIGVETVITDKQEILDCKNPYDHFALHKAALIACGIVSEDGEEDLEEILKFLGGGIYLSTKVVGIPKGSGLGTSSILAGACVKAIFEFLGEALEENTLYDVVLCMEQIMSTGGGWQDQVGGLCPGIKMITTRAGLKQNILVEKIVVPDNAMEELQKRFALIYTGQRRLARNLLRDVVGGYIGGRKKSLEALIEMKRVAVLMRFALENGDIDRFAELLNEHWKLSLQLDNGATNTCIDQIFESCDDLIDGRFIAGAGGGGFLQVIMKKGVTTEQLNQRLYEVFQDSGVAVWPCEFV
ncbi:MAG: bifunctional fucokinase/L-fucose-1-P-guanylyltransferase [Lachnospiraceae bacterium]|nr:bifunctional fucokinase/L-fucose-1-P-guanylyltransferase [Lachnospiraceae bacterium]